jgi:hypothetical protein
LSPPAKAGVVRPAIRDQAPAGTDAPGRRAKKHLVERHPTSKKAETRKSFLDRLQANRVGSE